MKHLLKLEDWSTEEIISTLNLADQLKYEQKHGIEHKLLKGKTLGMIFEKSSTRTRVSFEVGMTQLGGYPLFLSSNDLQIGRGEPVEDTARVLSRFIDAIMIRTFAQSEVEDLAKYGSIPIINGLTDYCHPCQVLADLMTIREFKGKLEGLKMCFIGDGNNMLNSLAVGALRTGMSFSAACPDGYFPPEHIMEFGKQFGDKSLRNAGAGLFDRGQRRCEIGSGLDVVESGERNIARNGASGVDDCPFCGNREFVVVGEHGVRIRI